MKRKFMLVIVLVITLVASSSAFAQTDITDLSTTSQLAELEPYITTTKDGGIFRQELD